MNTISMERLQRARTRLLLQQPFFGVIALSLLIEEDDSEDTLGVDGKSIFYNARWVSQQTDAQLTGAVAHEVAHVALKHHFRRGDRDPVRWNDAADYVVNPLVLDAGFQMPEGILYDAAFLGMGVEEVYARLLALDEPTPEPAPQNKPENGMQKPQGNSPHFQNAGDEWDEGEIPDKQPQNEPGQGETGPKGTSGPEKNGKGASEPENAPETPENGQNEPENGSKGENEASEPNNAPSRRPAMAWGSVRDAPEGAKEDALDVTLQQAANAGAAAGILPAYVERIVGEAKKEHVDWREVMQRFIDSKTVVDYTWNRPNRRLVSSGIILPGTTQDGVSRIGIAIDTSGSIDGEMLNRFIEQLQSMSDLNIIQELVVICVDAVVMSTQEFTKGDDLSEIKIKGGGGTRFAPAFKWFRDNEPDITAVIYFTDLICDDFGPTPDFPVLWAVWGHKSTFDLGSARLPFGEAVYISEGR